jgi:hypothetical protein
MKPSGAFYALHEHPLAVLEHVRRLGVVGLIVIKEAKWTAAIRGKVRLSDERHRVLVHHWNGYQQKTGQCSEEEDANLMVETLMYWNARLP